MGGAWVTLLALAFVAPGGNRVRPTTLPLPRLRPGSATCAAVSGSGISAVAWLMNGDLLVRFSGPATNASVMTIRLPSGSSVNLNWPGCDLAFNSNGSLLAVALNRTDPAHKFSTRMLHVIVVDVARRTVVQRFGIDEGYGARPPFGLLGFVGSSRNLAIWSAEKKLKLPGPVTYSETTTLLVRFPQSGSRPQVSVFHRRITGQLAWNDPLHNLLWYQSNPHLCPLRSISLTGVSVSGPTVGKDPVTGSGPCDYSFLYLFPDRDTLIGIASEDAGGRVYEVRLGEPSTVSAVLSLPRTHDHDWANVDSAHISPDGQVAVVVRGIESPDTLFGAGRERDDLVVVQTGPLSILAHINPPDHYASAGPVAIGDRNGKAVLLVCWDGTWMRYMIPLPTRPSGMAQRAVNSIRHRLAFRDLIPAIFSKLR
jgi:hypothetical protein